MERMYMEIGNYSSWSLQGMFEDREKTTNMLLYSLNDGVMLSVNTVSSRNIIPPT